MDKKWTKSSKKSKSSGRGGPGTVPSEEMYYRGLKKKSEF